LIIGQEMIRGGFGNSWVQEFWKSFCTEVTVISSWSQHRSCS